MYTVCACLCRKMTVEWNIDLYILKCNWITWISSLTFQRSVLKSAVLFAFTQLEFENTNKHPPREKEWSRWQALVQQKQGIAFFFVFIRAEQNFLIKREAKNSKEASGEHTSTKGAV